MLTGELFVTEPNCPTPVVVPAPDAVPKPLEFQPFRSVKARMLAGLLAILPLLLTLLIVSYIFNFVNWLMAPLSNWIVQNWFGGHTDNFLAQYPGLVLYPLSLILACALLYAVGVLADTKLRRMFDDLILRLPVIKKIYSSIERVVTSLAGSSQQQKGMFERVCFFSLVEGVQQVGFWTGHTRDKATGKLLLCIYVPTPPNPTSGLIFMVPPERVRLVEWSVEESVQTIVSGGMLMPHQVSFKSATIAEEPKKVTSNE